MIDQSDINNEWPLQATKHNSIHYIHNINYNISLVIRHMTIYNITFGLVQSPFLLGGTIEMHLDAWKETHPDVVEEIQRSLYVGDVITGMNTVEETKQLMETMIDVFKDA